PAPKSFGSGGASFRRRTLPDRARRSLKTQQHARLSTQSGRRCASRFDPSVPFTGREGLKKNPVIPRYETCIARATWGLTALRSRRALRSVSAVVHFTESLILA